MANSENPTNEELSTLQAESAFAETLVGRIEDDPIASQLMGRATFIPLRHEDLKHALIDWLDLQSEDQAAFEQLCGQLQSIFHVEHQSTLLRLEQTYELLDPDTQLVTLDGMTDDERHGISDGLIDQVAGLLFSAHYKRLTRMEIQRAIDVGWQWGVKLEVDFEIFERLEIFARGYRKVTVSRRRWQRCFAKEAIELPEFSRLIMVFRMKHHDDDSSKKKRKVKHLLDSRFVYLKTFKDIPETDVEILLPGSKIRLTKMDRAKILFPTLSGLAITIYKITRSALLLSLAFSWNVIVGWAILIAASIGYLVKSVLSYFRTKNDYQSGLTKNLYVKNLDNNLGVLYRILNEAEEQEVSESILAYTMLWRLPRFQRHGATCDELDREVESFIRLTTCKSEADKAEQGGDTVESNVDDCECDDPHDPADVDFEVHDALGKLARLGLATVDGAGYWRAVPMEQVRKTIRDKWTDLLP